MKPSLLRLDRVPEPVVLEPNYMSRFVLYYPAVHAVLQKETLGQVITLSNLGLEPEFAHNQDARSALTIAELTAGRPLTAFVPIVEAKRPWGDLIGANRPLHVRSRNGVVRGFSFNTWKTANRLLSDPRLAPWIIRLSGLKLQPADYLSLIAPLKPA